MVCQVKELGKSRSMGFYLRENLAQPRMENPVPTVLTNRSDPGRRLLAIFRQSRELLREIGMNKRLTLPRFLGIEGGAHDTRFQAMQFCRPRKGLGCGSSARSTSRQGATPTGVYQACTC